MDANKSNYLYRKQWNQSNYETVSVQVPKYERIKERIAAAARLKHITQAKYIKQAIETALQLDGITIDSIPTQESPPDRAE